VRAAAFSPDNRLMATGSDDRSVAVSDLQNGHKIREFGAGTSRVREVFFGKDGDVVAAASEDGTAHVWRMYGDLRTMLTRAKHMAPRCLTPTPSETAHLAREVPVWCRDLGKWGGQSVAAN
jgi:WD40 repeat protein